MTWSLSRLQGTQVLSNYIHEVGVYAKQGCGSAVRVPLSTDVTLGKTAMPDFFDDACTFTSRKHATLSFDGDAVVGAGPQKTCWLPYSKNAEGNCFAYDAAGIGWWKKTSAGTRRGTYTAVKGGTEEPMKPWSG